MIVLDASAVVELLVRLPLGDAVAARLADPDTTLHAPDLLLVETAHVVRRFTLAGTLGPDDGRRVLTDLVDLGVQTYPHEPLLPRVWQLRDALTAYDATYVALAEALGARLLTTDARLDRAAGVRCDVVVVGPDGS